MKSMFTLATVLALAAVVPTLGELGAVRASRGHQVFLAEASGPSPGGRDTAMMAESSGATRGGKDSALLAETESNGPSPGGRDSAQV